LHHQGGRLRTVDEKVRSLQADDAVAIDGVSAVSDRRIKSDVVIRHWALERALSAGGISTAQLRDHFDLTLQSAAKRLARMREAGYLELDERYSRYWNVLTDDGRIYLAQRPDGGQKRFNDSSLCSALGLLAFPITSAGRRHTLE
jgi:hypothetical protein